MGADRSTATIASSATGYPRVRPNANASVSSVLLSPILQEIQVGQVREPNRSAVSYPSAKVYIKVSESDSRVLKVEAP
jgi:hypothetical protein